MFDLKKLNMIKTIKVGRGLDGIMYDEPDENSILTNHHRPIGSHHTPWERCTSKS
jgi:hypothetical protein